MRPRLAIWSISLAAVLASVPCGAEETATGPPSQGILPDDIAALDKPTSSQAQTRKLLGMGFNALRNKDYFNAEKLLLRARRIEPTNPYILLNLGVVFYRTNRPTLAREVWTRVLNAPVAASSAVITSSPDLVGESPATVARRNLKLLDPPGSPPPTSKKP
jgi:Tfp pilus assembly protein PilF